MLPKGLEVDTFEGEAFLSIVPFTMENVRFRFLPPLPFSSLWELNLRTYVKHKNWKGVYFFTLDTDHPLAQWIARKFFNLPYRLRRMEGEIFEHDGLTEKISLRVQNLFLLKLQLGRKRKKMKKMLG